MAIFGIIYNCHYCNGLWSFIEEPPVNFLVGGGGFNVLITAAIFYLMNKKGFIIFNYEAIHICLKQNRWHEYITLKSFKGLWQNFSHSSLMFKLTNVFTLNNISVEFYQ